MDPTVIRNQINRILSSQSFASKGQLRKLLEVLHKNIDSQATLTPHQVIKELWPEETRTKRSADVATEMNRLRHALESYYDGEGKTDAITIILPNRSAAAADGKPEKRWIVAEPRNGGEIPAAEDRAAENHLPRAQAIPRSALKTIGAIAALGAVLGIVGYGTIRVLAVRDQPKFGRLDGSALVIVNAEGKEIWRKVFPDGLAPDWYHDVKEFGPQIWFADLEGKGHTSVLFSYVPPASSRPQSSKLICYSERGKEKWRWTPGRELPEIAGSPATYKTSSLGVLKAADKRPPRIVVASVHDPWWSWPAQIAILDSDGKTISEYWHSGSLAFVTLADLDGDGKEEIIATGSSEYERQATLVVLDPDRVFGNARPGQRWRLAGHQQTSAVTATTA